MTKTQNTQDWQAKVEVKLHELGQQKATMTYLEMVQHANIPPPQRIHQLTQFLETLIARDVRLNQPIRAARIVSKKDQIPALGFFQCLEKNGITPKASETHQQLHQKLLGSPESH